MNNAQSAKIFLFCCSSSFDPFEMETAFNESEYELKVIPVPCSGKIDILYLTKAFETGADGVVIVTCKEGECRYLEGNLRAKKRAEAVDSLLEETGLGRGRITVFRINDDGIEHIIKEVKNFINKIKELPDKNKATVSGTTAK